MILKQISVFEFLMFYGSYFPAIIRYYSKRMGIDDMLFIMLDNENLIGIAIIKRNSVKSAELVYIYVMPEHRQKGYGSKLFYGIIEELLKKQIKICYSRTVVRDENIYNIFSHWGFQNDGESIIIKCNIDDENIERWNKYSVRRKKAIEKWEKFQNIETVSFSDAKQSMIDYIYDINNNDFPKELNPLSIVRGKCGDLVTDLSFISYNEKPVAYTMVTSADKNSLIFSHISTAENWKGTGVFAGAFFNSMEKIIKSDYKIISYAVKNDNKIMLNLVSSMLSYLTLKKERQVYWNKTIGKE